MISSSIFLAIPGPASMILIVVAILLLFGGKKIPELMKGLGSGLKEFKDASKDDSKEIKEEKKN
ncbi:twin-arginine translocase TatA/TatE family subunit [Winogradskyella litorisediminis]|uniref:Sec-independent protein translocase protein TatA n=1 Tax=Winogradskyella litorisediminis TaxID=1156618 RepID=A0ABW3N6Q4_9FLAO